MPRKCTGCDYTTDDPFLGKCPWCSKPLAVVSRCGNRAPEDTDWRRQRPARRRLTSSEGGWLPRGWGVWLMIVLVVGGLLFTAAAGGRRQRPATGQRVRIGMPLRDAILTLEPAPPAGGVVSLHDLLDVADTASGTFTHSDRSPVVRVTFRNGKVTGVSELDMRFAGTARQVDIQLDPRD